MRIVDDVVQTQERCEHNEISNHRHLKQQTCSFPWKDQRP